MNLPTRLLPCVLFAAPMMAQATWTVTSPTGVQAAIDAASPGDIILLPNTGGVVDYECFGVVKGVTIRGNGCRIGASSSASASFFVFVDVPPGQRAHLDGLDFGYGFHPQFGNVGTTLQVTGGTLTVQRCALRQRVVTAATVANCRVVFEHCSIHAEGGGYPGQGINAANARITLHDCSVTGADATASVISLSAQPAVQLVDSSLHAERTSFRGGNNALSGRDAADGIVMLGSSRMWLADCTVAGGNNSFGSGKPALRNTTGIAAEVANTTLQAGTPGSLAVVGPVATAPLVRLALAPSFQRGTTSTLTFQGSPGALYGLWLALDSTASLVPEFVEPIWFVGGIPVAWGLLDATGAASYPVVVPDVPVLQYATAWCQAVGGSSLPLRASTVAGGMIE
jgi:hypothetical protein